MKISTMLQEQRYSGESLFMLIIDKYFARLIALFVLERRSYDVSNLFSIQLRSLYFYLVQRPGSKGRSV